MNTGRQVGVTLPENQRSEEAPHLTVTNIVETKFVLVEYGDENGRKQTTLALIINGKAFIPPQGTAWTASFKPFSKVINDQIMDKLALKATPQGTVPTKDAVDLFANASDDVMDATEAKLRTGG